MFTVTIALAKRIESRFDSIEEAEAYAQRKANQLKSELPISYTSHEGRTEFVKLVRPEAKPRKLAIFAHLANCDAAGMTIEEAAHAWATGDYRC